MAEKTIERICEYCGGTFNVIPSRIKHGRGRTCSRGCQYALMKSRPSNGGIIICCGCGNEYSRPKSHTKKAKYCSRECRDKYWVGEATPNYQDGSGVYKRGPNWHSIRRHIIDRDKCCVQCGSSENLHVHHKIPFRMFNDHEQANLPENLITLCPVCHRKEDAHFKWIKTDEDNILKFKSGGIGWKMAKEKGLL